MNIFKYFKGKLKQKELRKLQPDESFEFEKEYFGNTEILEGFRFLCCNNYTDKLYKSNKNNLSFISCEITLPKSQKITDDIVIFTNAYILLKSHTSNTFEYKNFYIETKPDRYVIYLRGDIGFYEYICKYIHNNIITRYIRNNIFVDESIIDTPNEYLYNIYNSITNPFKEIDILFIEDNCLGKPFNPVIGLSINENSDFLNYINNKIVLNRRYIIYCEIYDMNEKDLDFLIANVKYGNKILDVIHKGIEEDDIDLEVDEIIED